MSWAWTVAEPSIDLPKRVFHFTMLDTFALILQTRTLRLNRLDRVEDLADGLTNIPSSQSIAYASCWTATGESFAMWKLYAGGNGVRISYDPSVPPFAGVGPGRAYRRVQRHDLMREGLVPVRGPTAPYRTLDLLADREAGVQAVLPRLADLQRVVYQGADAGEDGGLPTQDVTRNRYVDAGTGASAGTSYDHFAIGLLKHRMWEFEDEWRYVGILEKPNRAFLGTPEPHPDAASHYDLALRPDFFACATTELQLGPLAGDEERSRVVELLQEYAPEFDLERLTHAEARVRRGTELDSAPPCPRRMP